MARKPTDKQLFKMKNEWLGQFYEEVKPRDFYRAVFPEGSFEREGHPEDEKCNGVLTVIEGEKARNYIVFDELKRSTAPTDLPCEFWKGCPCLLLFERASTVVS